ncbi:hypothetical protein OIU78_015028 [Salix suchowensis]|nr:hypothetical protein OIU78_015028 [Salix suchowensis]
MAKTKPGKKDLDSYTIKGTNKVVRAGDCVLMRPSDTDKLPYVARIEKIEADHRNNVKCTHNRRFEYKAATGGFTPDRVAVYCKCEMPYNPDDLMVQCEGCKDW